MAGKSSSKKATDIKLDTIERVILYVQDTERSARFYHETLGVPVRNKDKGWVELETKGTTLCLHSGRRTKGGEPQAHVAFQVKDFDGTYRALQIREVDGLSEPHSPCGGVRCASFRDPDGNVLGIEGK